MFFPKIILLYITALSESVLYQHLSSLPLPADCTIESLSTLPPSMALSSSLSKEPYCSKALLITDTVTWLNGEPLPVDRLPTLGIGTDGLFGIPYVFESLDSLDTDGISLVFCRFHHLPLTLLETKHLLLKEWAPEQAVEFQTLYRSFPPSDHLPPLPDDLDEVKQYLSDYQKGAYEFFEHGLWAVFHKETQSIIGQCGIEYKERDGIARYELQYMITPSFQGKGLAFEICSEVLSLARDFFYIEILHALIEPENTRSIALIEKLGFQKIDSIRADRKQVLVYEKICFPPKSSL